MSTDPFQPAPGSSKLSKLLRSRKTKVGEAAAEAEAKAAREAEAKAAAEAEVKAAVPRGYPR